MPENPRERLAKALDKEQKRRRIPFTQRVYVCPKCGNRLARGAEDKGVAYFYCKSPRCDYSMKVDIKTGNVNVVIARLEKENQELKEENQQLRNLLPK